MTKPNGDTASDGVDDRPLEHDGMLWKPRPGATATAEEFIAARQLVIALHEDEDWNPWATEDRAQEYEAALTVAGQWTRAEPGFRQLTRAEWEAQMRKVDEECAVERQEKERRRRARIPTFDKARHDARLRVLERVAACRSRTSWFGLA